MPQPDAPIAELVGIARQSGAWVRKQIGRLLGINRDARALFIGEDGELRPEAERLFARLADEAQLNRIGIDPDARHADYRKGQQDMLRFMIRMIEIDTRRLEELQRKAGDR